MYNIREFGARGDGAALETEAIKAAIRACNENGGGTVIVPAGRYVTAPFELLSHTNLHLEPGAVVVASPDIDDYFLTHTSMESPRAGLIYATDAKHISITGSGTIDCQGTLFMDMSRLHQGGDFDGAYTRQGELFRKLDQGIEDGPVAVVDRPGNPLQFIRCEHVALRDIVILNSPNWTIHFDDSVYIVVSGITILNELLIPNSDGIHFTTCRHVRVSDCHIQSGDDSLAFTGYGTPGHKTEHVTVTNCTLISRSSAIRIGYGVNDVRNCLFHNLTIQSNRGLGIFQRNEGTVANIVFSDIVMETRLHTGHWWGHGEPIHISAAYNVDADRIGTIAHIRFSNVLAQGESGMIIHGCPDSVIEDILLDNVRFEVKPSPLADRYGGNFDLRPTNDPHTSLFAHDERGLYATHVRGLRLHNFRLSWNGEPPAYFRHGIELDACAEVEIDGYAGRAPHQTESSKALLINGCHDVSVRNERTM